AVAYEIPEHLPHLSSVAHCPEWLIGSFVSDCDILRAPLRARRELDNVAGKRSYVDRLWRRLSRSRHIHHVRHEMREASRLRVDDVPQSLVFFTQPWSLTEELDRARDRSERVADLVREPSRNSSQHREPLRRRGALVRLRERSTGPAEPFREVGREHRDD